MDNQNRNLPVLNFAPFRRYPTRSNHQEFTDDRQVCHQCLSGVCCSNQDAIALTSFDIFRLAAFFDMSPAAFMLNFTQDEFDGDYEDHRRGWNEDADSSIVTWLRRRANSQWSPCIFLKYVRDPDGTPHRICSVHDARPLSCREFYFSHCKTRGTGELASLLAEGFEKVRDGEITEEMVDTEIARFGAHDFETSTLAENLALSFWAEMKCVVNMDQANVEGANSFNLADYQDPIDDKLNRVLSAKYLRSEEDYGLRPRDEQLMPYTSGRSFAGSSEYERLTTIVRTTPATGLFNLGSYRHYVGLRTKLPGVKHADVFPAIPETEISSFLNSVPEVRLFPHHLLPAVRGITQRDIYAAVLKACNYLIRFSSHIASVDAILEHDPEGTIESELLKVLTDFETSLNPYIANNPYLKPVKVHMAGATIGLLENSLEAAPEPADLFDCLRTLSTLELAKATLPGDVKRRVTAVSHEIHQRLKKNRLSLYVSMDNPIERRRAAGKRLGINEAWRAWHQWYGQVLDMRQAAFAGFEGLDLVEFYQRSVGDLEKLLFRESYSSCLKEIVKYLSQSMTFGNRISFADMNYKDPAARLATYGINLFNWAEEKEEWDCETDAEFLAAIYKGLGLSYNHDRNFGLIIHRLLRSQLPDGSWLTALPAQDEPQSQGEYLEIMYRATAASINALRPLRNDLLNPANAALGLT